MRLFLGIPLSTTVTDQLASAIHRLRSRPAAEHDLRWSAPEGWHITLQFLGSTTAEQYACVVERLRDLHLTPVSITLDGISSFERAGVLVVGVELTPELLALHEAVTATTSACGFEPEDRPYHPHITLARSRGRSREQSLRALRATVQHQPLASTFVAESYVLYESMPGPKGSRYTIRQTFALE